MATVSIRTRIAAPPDLLWDLVGRFGTLGQWHPGVRRSATTGRGKGAVRQLKLADGSTAVERLEHVSDAERVCLYSVLHGPLPVTDCVVELRVTDRGGGTSEVEWTSNFTPSGVPERDAARRLRDDYARGLENLKRIYEPAEGTGA
jgi:uncharacterized protein YndB with AHSA1/START domain